MNKSTRASMNPKNIPALRFAFVASRRLAIVVWILSVSQSTFAEEEVLLSEDFESYNAGQSILASARWNGFEEFHGEILPSATIIECATVDGLQALAVSHSEKYRTDNWGVRAQLTEPVSDGVVWVQCLVKPPKQWTGGLYFDIRGEKTNETVARIAVGPSEVKNSNDTELRWHSVFSRVDWRLYTKAPIDQQWHKLTTRIDFELGTYAGWVDGQTLGEDLPLTSRAPFSQVHIGIAGASTDPALIDNLVVSRAAPDGFQDPQLLPKPDDDLIFRFAATGDPQLGFTTIETDKARFAHATDQINRSGAELSLMLGDMVHFQNDLNAYETMQELVKRFDNPYHYVRGNHDVPELFMKYFYRKLHYSIVHKGIRFVIIDAEGNHVGMSDQQLDWIESEFRQAEKSGEEIVIALHVSPWENNERGRGKYNQIGKGRERLRALMKKHKVLLSLSGHYHRALWHGHEEETHYLVLGGTARVKVGGVAWCVFDVYPDRVVVHQKPLFFAYETENVLRIHTANGWLSYKQLKEEHPYALQGPLTINRQRPSD